MKRTKIQNMVQIALLGAVANVLFMIRFPLPFMPPFMDFDLSGAAEMVGAFLMGPGAGVLIAGIKILLKLFLSGTTSMFIGEIQSFLLSAVFILATYFIYRRNPTRKGALFGMLLGVFLYTFVAILSNVYVVLPLYSELYHLSIDDIIKMTQALNPYVNSELKFVFLGIAPFNLIKAGATTGLVYMLYPVLNRLRTGETKHIIH